MLSIQTNVNSMNAQENLRVTNQFQGRTIARLTSGFRINESGDDAAGLAVANKYRSDVTELVQGVRNANDGLSTLQIIDGGLNNVSKMLDRMKTLATQSASETFTGDRATLNKEYTDLLNEVDRQAGMIGLAGTGTTATRNNTQIDVYVGGSMQGTAKVAIELGGAANQVDSAGLKLTGTAIGKTFEVDAGTATASGVLQAAAATPGSQAFVFSVDGGADQTITITAPTTAGVTTNEAVQQLNEKLKADSDTAGITASIKNDKLTFSSEKTFTLKTATAANAAAGKGLVADIASTVNPTTVEGSTNAEAAITSIQNAVSALGLVQGKVGTAQNKLGYAIQLAQSQITSFSAAESRIRDADVAQEAANLTKAQVLQQASLAALGQANSAPQAVLSLLRG